MKFEVLESNEKFTPADVRMGKLLPPSILMILV